MKSQSYGITARFLNPDAFREALEETHRSGFTQLEANTPFPVDGAEDYLPGKKTPMAAIVLIAALLGAGGAYFMQWYAARDYPVNVGGRPLHSWPAFIPVTFELSVLTSAIVGVIALLYLAGLPRLDHPLFSADGFQRATQDRFFICVRSTDPNYDPQEITRLFLRLGAESIEEVSR